MTEPVIEQSNVDFHSRFYRYLIDMKYALREADFDDGVDIGEDHTEDSGKKSHDKFQRTLLAVEERRIRREKIRQAAEANTINAMAKSLRPHIIKHVKESIQDPEYAVKTLLRMPANFCDLVDIVHSPTMTYSRVAGVVKLNNIHDRNLVQMVNRADFQKQIGKSMSSRIKETQMAISLLGEGGIRALLPVMMVKQTIKFRHEFFPLLGFKLWKLMLTNGLSAHYILKNNGYPDPVEGLLAGILYNIGNVSIYHQFVQSFEEVKRRFLVEFRKDNKKMQHDYLLKVEPEPVILFQLLQEHARSHSLEIIKELGLHRQRPRGLSMAIEQALSLSTIQQCTPLAKAVRQGNAYAILEQLRHAKLVGKENIGPFLDEVGMTKEEMSTLLKRNLTRLELKDFVE